MSIEASEQQPQSHDHYDATFLTDLLGPPLPVPRESQPPDMLQSYTSGALEPLPFAHGAFDPSFNPPLDFSFEDLIDNSATVAVDGHGAL